MIAINIQCDINAFTDWCLKNDLEINVSKYSQILLSRKNIEICTNLNYLITFWSPKPFVLLTIWVSSDRSFNNHIYSISY